MHIQPFLRQAVSYRDERITSQRFDGMDRDDLSTFRHRRKSLSGTS